MKKFIINILLFSALTSIILGAFELYARNYITPQKEKAHYIRTNGENIQIIFLGSSLTTWGISPGWLNQNGIYNPSFEGWNPQQILCFLDEFTPFMPNLKKVFIEVAYPTFRQIPYELTPTAWQSIIPLQRDYGYKRHSKWSKYGFEIAYPEGFRNKVLPWQKKSNLLYDSLGHAYYMPLSISQDLNYSYEWVLTGHTIDSNIYVDTNFLTIAAIIAKCIALGAEPILYTPPVHNSYLTHLEKAQNEEWTKLSHSLQWWFNIKWINCSNLFPTNNEMFYDAAHLNTDMGALAFTHHLEQLLNDHIKPTK